MSLFIFVHRYHVLHENHDYKGGYFKVSQLSYQT